ncbi:hypothetical protein [Streptomyces flaveolus]|uniref:hypothetical protein n=1 Tax=Streptomyces flaveolus TaxID=67297 RepID=UPI00368DB1AA
MTDEKHEQDLERVSGQNTFTDLTRHAEQNPSDGFLFGAIDNLVRTAAKGTPYARGVHGRTNFDDHRLNDMIDLVEQTNPEDLESSGKALWDARDAITEAAKELDGHIENVHWVGESGEAFRKWGRSLVTSTYGLSDFAGGAGDQITAAAVGLAAVRKAMPPRDTRPAGQDVKPEKLPTPKQVEGNPEYAEAVRVEKDRQEAINQMNRLSSYYAVANEQLIALPPPEFKTMPDVGVPKPKTDSIWHPSAAVRSGAEQGGDNPGNLTSRHTAEGVESRARTQDVSDTAVIRDGNTRPTLDPIESVGTAIDSTVAPTVHTAPSHGQTLPTPLPPAEGSGSTGPFSTGPAAPFPPARSAGRTNGRSNGLRSPLTAPGRVTSAAPGNKGITGPGRQLSQGPLNQMGRTAPNGQPTAKGVASGAKPISPSHGVSGGTPRANSSATPKATSGPVTGAGRGNGVVGGRPGSVPGGAGRGGARIPRGTVVGAEATSNSQPGSGRPGQRGGTNGSAPAKSPVTGTPAGRGSAAGAERNGMTRGGAGLLRGPGGRNNRPDERGEQGAERPDYLVEDAETHLPSKTRRDVPPVVN